APPPGFTAPLLAPRGVLALCPHGAEARFDQVLAAGLTAPVPVREVDRREAQRYCPVLRPGWYSRAMLKPGAMDIDVDAVHQGFLRGIRRRGGHVVRSAGVRALRRHGGRWRAVTEAGDFSAGCVIHAATTLQIRHVQRAWAGLRSAVADDTPVIGPAPGAAGFIWLAGLSGYGIQTAPAAGALAAALATGTQPRLAGQQAAVDLAALAPGRLPAGPAPP